MSAPVYDRHGIRVHHGDCLEVMRTLTSESVHAVITDPPAAIRFMNRAWDSDMGGRHSWVAWLAERMREAHRVLKPGGYGLVWALPRTSHWTAWALEDAGFEIRDCIIHAFGAGMPKSLDVGKAIDKRGGNAHLASKVGDAIRTARQSRGLSMTQADKLFCGGSTMWSWFEGRNGKFYPPTPDTFAQIVTAWPELSAVAELVAAADREVIGQRTTGIGTGRGSVAYIADSDNRDVTAPATDAARQWDGWGTSLKPSQEMWWLIRKPMAGTVAQTVLEHGTGALNMGGCKVGYRDAADRAQAAVPQPAFGVKDEGAGSYNFRAGEGRNGARFDPGQGRWPANLVLTHAGRCDDDGCRPEWCPVAELDAQSGDLKGGVTVRRNLGDGREQNANGIYGSRVRPASEDMTYGDSGGASRFFHTFRWEAKAPPSERPMVGGKAHETVKPLGLLRFFVKLVCAPGGTVLDCFAGTGTTGQAARAEGMKAILIEQDPDHIDKIRARLDARPKTTAAQAAPADGEPMDLLDLLDGSAS